MIKYNHAYLTVNGYIRFVTKIRPDSLHKSKIYFEQYCTSLVWRGAIILLYREFSFTDYVYRDDFDIEEELTVKYIEDERIAVVRKSDV